MCKNKMVESLLPRREIILSRAGVTPPTTIVQQRCSIYVRPFGAELSVVGEMRNAQGRLVFRSTVFCRWYSVRDFLVQNYVVMTTPAMNMKPAIVRVDPEIHRRNENYTHEMIEFGGIMDYNPSTNYIDHKSVFSNGLYNNVVVPRGLVQFHTHPQQCKQNACAMGVPSIEDLLGFASAVVRGETLIHALYSADGTYVMMLQPEVRRMLESDATNFLPVWLDVVEEDLARFKVQNPVTRATYDRWKFGWIEQARSVGFDIQHWAPGNPPSVHIYSDNIDAAISPCDDYLSYRDAVATQPQKKPVLWVLRQLRTRCNDNPNR